MKQSNSALIFAKNIAQLKECAKGAVTFASNTGGNVVRILLSGGTVGHDGAYSGSYDVCLAVLRKIKECAKGDLRLEFVRQQGVLFGFVWHGRP